MSTLTDREFLKRFFELTLDPEEFHHEGHLRMAWLMLKQYPVEIAISKGCQGIQNYAGSLGAPDKYHQTISHALFYIMQRRGLGDNWQAFIKANQDLVVNSIAVLANFYSEDLLFSDQAKHEYVTPDKQAF